MRTWISAIKDHRHFFPHFGTCYHMATFIFSHVFLCSIVDQQQIINLSKLQKKNSDVEKTAKKVFNGAFCGALQKVSLL